MQVTRLDVRALRRLAEVSMAPGPGLNLITGENGAGKTSVLEALHLMAYGRSFRGRVRDGLVATGAAAVEVFVEWREQPANAPDTVLRRAGLRHSGQTWEGRLDGEGVAQLTELCAALAVISFDPESHSLVSGGGEIRRRYLDWGLFHVEPDFLPLWRRYARALKQRNALLKQCAKPAELEAWEHELSDAGEPLSRRRQAYLQALTPHIAVLSGQLMPALGGTETAYQSGWKRDLPLADALLLARDRDLQTGFTSVGPHRADWRLSHATLPQQETLSRGQAKMTALSCLLAQAAHYADARGEWPVLALDDLASELDPAHRERILRYLLESGAQVFVTGTHVAEGFVHLADARMFHVERGIVTSTPPA